MFKKQQPATELQKARVAYLPILEKVKLLGLHEDESVPRSDNHTHPSVQCDKVDATVDATVRTRTVCRSLSIRKLLVTLLKVFMTSW
jgi:hypothetical protein